MFYGTSTVFSLYACMEQCKSVSADATIGISYNKMGNEQETTNGDSYNHWLRWTMIV